MKNLLRDPDFIFGVIVVAIFIAVLVFLTAKYIDAQMTCLRNGYPNLYIILGKMYCTRVEGGNTVIVPLATVKAREAKNQ